MNKNQTELTKTRRSKRAEALGIDPKVKRTKGRGQVQHEVIEKVWRRQQTDNKGYNIKIEKDYRAFRFVMNGVEFSDRDMRQLFPLDYKMTFQRDEKCKMGRSGDYQYSILTRIYIPSDMARENEIEISWRYTDKYMVRQICRVSDWERGLYNDDADADTEVEFKTENKKEEDSYDE